MVDIPFLGSIGGSQCLSGPMKCIVMMVLLLYIISPIDLIPEALLGPLGLIDDAFAGLMLFGVAGKDMFGKMGNVFK